MPRSSSVRRTRHGAPGVSCSPATKPSLSQRSRVDGAIFSWRAAAVTLSSAPSGSSPLPSGWWQGMCRWWRSDWTLLAVYDNPRAVRRCCRLRIPAMTASGEGTAGRRIRAVGARASRGWAAPREEGAEQLLAVLAGGGRSVPDGAEVIAEGQDRLFLLRCQGFRACGLAGGGGGFGGGRS